MLFTRCAITRLKTNTLKILIRFIFHFNVKPTVVLFGSSSPLQQHVVAFQSGLKISELYRQIEANGKVDIGNIKKDIADTFHFDAAIRSTDIRGCHRSRAIIGCARQQHGRVGKSAIGGQRYFYIGAVDRISGGACHIPGDGLSRVPDPVRICIGRCNQKRASRTIYGHNGIVLRAAPVIVHATPDITGSHAKIKRTGYARKHLPCGTCIAYNIRHFGKKTRWGDGAEKTSEVGSLRIG